ncbi:hypothetical protein MF672_049540 [Actinomadura sp. ATCC 31491]|uniref:Phosphotransferase n=1 Tax=Actinomadura luzonensis TaxID=2805427 RepID=A0ABT0GB12_9ACTN|nr:hypothetical protein [Actinomadura luzonensis]MCK2221800.1 hypothetical protein [Actinomadura luzonensis]
MAAEAVPAGAVAAGAVAAGAVAAAVAVAREHGVRVERPVVLNDSFNVRVHLRPAPVVARVPTVTAYGRERPAEVLRRELAVVAWLHAAEAAVVPPSGLLPPGPHLRDGFAVSFWTHVEHDPGRVVPAETAGRSLAELHAALRGYPGELPYLWPVREETARLLELLDGRIDPGAHARLDGRAAVRAYGADPGDPGLAPFVAARALQGTLWLLVRALRLPRYAPEARHALEAWLRDPGGATR